MSKKTDDRLTQFKLYSPLKVIVDIIESIMKKRGEGLYEFISSMVDQEDISFIKEISYEPDSDVIIVSLKPEKGSDINSLVYWDLKNNCWDLDEDGQKTGSDALEYYWLENN